MVRRFMWLTLCLVLSLCESNYTWADGSSNGRLSNWHQWRGPNATGFAPLGDPPTNWDEQTNIRWKVPIPGQGTSTPIIWGDRIFLMTAIETDRRAEPATDDVERGGERGGRSRPTNFHQFVVLCLDKVTGQTLWQRTACEVVPHQGHHPTSTYVAASPITDGRYVYCWFGSRGIYCYDVEGKQQWQADLGRFDIKFGFGEGSSPALYGDRLVVKCDHEKGSFITALGTANGRPVWKVPREEKSTWNTPLVTEYDGRVQVITSGAVALRSYDLANGELIWECRGREGVDAIPSPLRLDDLAILVSGFRGKAAFGVRLTASGDITDSPAIAWQHDSGTPQIATPVLVGERLYFTKDRAGIVTCLDARTGRAIIDQKRLPVLDDIYPSPVAAAGRAYFTDRHGATVVIDTASDDVVVLAENRLDEKIVGSPAIVGREMFIRGEASLYCIQE